MMFYPFTVTTPQYVGFDVVTQFGADPSGVRDSTANFQACINAAVAVQGQMTIPAGTYNLNTGGLSITGPFRMVGLGAGWDYYNGSLIPGVILNCTGAAGGGQGSASLFNFPSQGFLWGGMEHQGCSVNYSGTGNVYNQVNFADSVFRDMQITLTAAGSTAMFTSGTNSFINCFHDRCQFITTAASRTAPMISLTSSVTAAISNNTFWKCKLANKGLDNTQYMVLIQCTGTGSSYHYEDNFIECWFEHPFGGAYKSLSGQNIKVESCSTWDIQAGQGVTVGNSTYYFGASTTPSQAVRVINCSRNLNGPDGAATWDIFCESTTSQVHVEGFTVASLNPTTTYNAFINLNGCHDVVLLNNMSPQGSAVNGNSTTVISNPSPTQLLISQGAVTSAGPVDISAAGQGVKVAEGSNAKQGTATLAAGTVTVANTSVTASSRIFLTTNTPGGAPGWLQVSARVAGTSFTILSSSNTDTSVVAYEIFEPG